MKMIDNAPIIEAVVALIIAVLTYLTNKYRKRAADIELFYDADSAHRVPAEVIDSLNPRTWKMPQSVKDFACCDLSDADRETFHRLVKEAEEAYSVRYDINLSDRIYRVEYGQIVGSACRPEKRFRGLRGP